MLSLYSVVCLCVVGRLLEQQSQLVTLLTTVVLQQQSQVNPLMSQVLSQGLAANSLPQPTTQQLLQFLQSQAQSTPQPPNQSLQLPNMSTDAFNQLLQQLPGLNQGPSSVDHSIQQAASSTQLPQSIISSPQTPVNCQPFPATNRISIPSQSQSSQPNLQTRSPTFSPTSQLSSSQSDSVIHSIPPQSSTSQDHCSYHSASVSEGTSCGTSSTVAHQDDCFILDEFSWDDTRGEDSDYMTWDTDNALSSVLPERAETALQRPTTNRTLAQPPTNPMLSSASTSDRDDITIQPPAIPPPFDTPPKLCSVEQVMKNFPGKDIATLRSLTVALARDAIFGRDVLAKCSLSGRKGTGVLCNEKVHYIKQLVHSRVPNKSIVDFENIWSMCRLSLSKSCQTIRNHTRKKILSDF